MKKSRKIMFIVLALVVVVGAIGYLVYDQVDAYSAYPNEPISIKTVSKGFSIRTENTSIRAEFASNIIQYKGSVATQAAGEEKPVFYWYVKQGAHIIQEMPSDGVLRQSNRARVGKYTLTIGESGGAGPFSRTLQSEGRTLVGSVDYQEAYWPKWPSGRSEKERAEALANMGMYRVSEDG